MAYACGFANTLPAFEHIRIESAGKYLGWYLGRNSHQLSFEGPIQKYKDRVLEVVGGRAPSTQALIRYNQRAVPVLSFVAQFAFPPDSFNLPALEQISIHKVLRLPPNCMSRNLMHNIAFATAVAPTRIADTCLAIAFRFAVSERKYLIELEKQILSMHCNEYSVREFSINELPYGGIHDRPVLTYLLDALRLQGPHEVVAKKIREDGSLSWMDPRRPDFAPRRQDKIQTALIKCLRPPDSDIYLRTVAQYQGSSNLWSKILEPPGIGCRLVQSTPHHSCRVAKSI